MEINMRFIICGAGQWGTEILNAFIARGQAEDIIAFGDNDGNKWESGVIGQDGKIKPIYSMKTCFKLYQEEKIDYFLISILDEEQACMVAQQIFNEGIDKILFVPLFLRNNFDKIGDLCKEFFPIKSVKPILDEVDISIIDSCNLRCKGCLVYANITKNEKLSFDSVEDLRRDFSNLKNKFRVKHVTVFGGEPLMHPQLEDVLDMIRSGEPRIGINIVTNGLLIPSLDSKVLEALYRNGVLLSISLYDLTERIKLQIEKILCEKKIDYVMRERKYFYRLFTKENNHDPIYNFNNCPIGGRCRTMYRGNISHCSVPFNSKRHNELFGVQVGDENVKQDIIDLETTSLNGWGILKKYSHPMEMCKWCNIELDWYAWKNGGAVSSEDWLNRKG